MWTASVAEKAKSAFAYARQYVQEQQLGERFESSGRSGSGPGWANWVREWSPALRPATEAKEEVSLVPGWAARVPRPGPSVEGVRPFDIHLWVSGYAVLSRSLTEATRGQRALVSLAKRYAALPQPVEIPPFTSQESGSLPVTNNQSDQLSTRVSSVGGAVRSRYGTTESTDRSFALPEVAKVANRNLDLRLSPFWSKPLAFRPIRISVEPPSGHQIRPSHSTIPYLDQKSDADPLLIVGSTTDGQGHFAHRLVIPWERLRGHPSWPHTWGMCQSDRQKWRLRVSVRLEANPVPVAASEQAPSLRPTTTHQRQAAICSAEQSGGLERQSQAPEQNNGAEASGMSQTRPFLHIDDQTSCQATESHLDMAVHSDGGIRIISDLDDTVKHSDILAGGRETFRNVFCRPISDICVPGADELFRAAKDAGVDGFHFVSNSPFELLPSIREFLAEHRFPKDYSLKLKYYGGRSMLSALFESPADRKRPAIIDILDSFPSARFILFGDSGEQDLELYTSIALERPAQVAAIYIRDISSTHETTQDPPGTSTSVPVSDQSSNSRAGSPLSSAERSMQHDLRGGNNSPPRSNSALTEEATFREELQALSSAQQRILRRAAAWRIRLEQARSNVPDSVDLVIFREIQEITARVVRQISDLS